MMGRETTIETMGREKSQASRLLDGGRADATVAPMRQKELEIP